MTGWIVELNPDSDRQAWITDAESCGMVVIPYKNLPKLMHIYGEPLPSELSAKCKTVEPDNMPTVVTGQSLSIAEDFSGASWAIARVIRRRAPWPVTRLQFPRSTHFECIRYGSGVDVYIMDTGVLPGHNEVAGRVTSIYEETSSGGLGDDNGHGTSMASLACGNTVGTARGASVLSVRVMNTTGGGTNAALINGIDAMLSSYAGRDNPAVCNMSLGGFSSTVNSAVGSAINAGIVVVGSAGNNGEDLSSVDQLPAESDAEVIVVGGLGPADLPYYRLPSVALSNYGTRVDVLAPGQSVYQATIPDANSYRVANGTSTACAVATGVVACMLEGRDKPISRGEVAAIRDEVINNASTGHLRGSEWATYPGTLPDRIIYLDPLDGPNI